MLELLFIAGVSVAVCSNFDPQFSDWRSASVSWLRHYFERRDHRDLHDYAVPSFSPKELPRTDTASVSQDGTLGVRQVSPLNERERRDPRPSQPPLKRTAPNQERADNSSPVGS